MRGTLKKIIHLWPWPLTLNERYDRQTKAILKKVCKPDSVCVDVGCFRGDILRAMMTAAPKAYHIAFEPVPGQFAFLKEHFSEHADIYPYALGNENKETIFHHVVSNPTYSGLQQRTYKGEEEIREIKVQVRKLDEVIAHDIPIALLKIDVEGGEFDVIKGATEIIQKWHPYIIFEHGVGGADKYGIHPAELFDMLTKNLGYRICLMGDFLKNDNAKGFSKNEFEEQFKEELNCYFIAISS